MSDLSDLQQQITDRIVNTETPQIAAQNQGLVAQHIGKSYKKRPALRDVSLRLQRGEAVGLLGPNGAGKTTCFYVITGLVSADYGSVLLDGHDITSLPMYRRARGGIGYLPQEASIFRGMSVEDNIRAVLEVVEPVRDRREALLDDLLAEFSVNHPSALWWRAPPSGNRKSTCISTKLYAS